MRQTEVGIQGGIEEARLEGAERLGVRPDEVTLASAGPDLWSVSIKDRPGQFGIEVRDDGMAVFIKVITPPLGDGPPVTVANIDESLKDHKITQGIDRQAIESALDEVLRTGAPLENIQIAAGEPPCPGENARIELKIGRDAANEDPQARNMVKPGQVLAVKVPATKGVPGRNVFGEVLNTRNGVDMPFSPGENVTLSKDGTQFVSTLYGTARATLDAVSVVSAVKIGPDLMWAEMSLFPTLADNSRLEPDDVAQVLKQAGIVQGIREEAIREAIVEGTAIGNLRVAEGLPPRDGSDARIAFRFLLNGEDPMSADTRRAEGVKDRAARTKNLVTDGDVLAIKHPLEKSEDGVKVTGGVLKGRDGRDTRIEPGKNVQVLDDGMTYVVADGVAGYADYQGGVLFVEEALQVAEDNLTARLLVYPAQKETDKRLIPEMVETLLAERGIVYGINREAVTQALMAGTKGEEVFREVVIAEGEAPVHGEDARIELTFDPGIGGGTIREGSSGWIDFKERSLIKNVKPGDVLALKTPATPGSPGVDVFGRQVPARPGEDKDLRSAGNATLSEDGLRLTAEIEGMVTVYQQGDIGVFQQYDVAGDVDYSTGNLTMDGSVNIRGWIRSGFSVKASGDIRIGGGVEDATVEAGANILVEGGIIGAGKGNVYAKGNLVARYLDNAHVRADGSVVVRDQIIRSIVFAGERIITTEGKGRVRGGTIEAVKGIQVNEIGSEVGVETCVQTGVDTKRQNLIKKITERLEELAGKRAKMDAVLTHYAKRDKGKSLPKETARNLTKLLKIRQMTRDEEHKLEAHREGLAAAVPEKVLNQASVEVKKAVYPGAVIMIRSGAYRVKDDLRGKSRFVFDRDRKTTALVSERLH